MSDGDVVVVIETQRDSKDLANNLRLTEECSSQASPTRALIFQDNQLKKAVNLEPLNFDDVNNWVVKQNSRNQLQNGQLADDSNLAYDNYSVLSNSMQGSPADTQIKIKIEVSQERGTESLLGPKGISELDTS